MRLADKSRRCQAMISKLQEDILRLKDHLREKITWPDGDGNASNLINVTTDVIPILQQMLVEIADCQHDIS